MEKKSEIAPPNYPRTLQQQKVKPFVELIKGGGKLSKLANNLDFSIKNSPEKNSPMGRIGRGSVARLRAKFEQIGTLESIDRDKDDKVEVNRLNSSSKKLSTPAKRGRKPRVKSSKKDSSDPSQSKINDFFRGVRR